jgi:DNA-binding NtrC family response regulator
MFDDLKGLIGDHPTTVLIVDDEEMVLTSLKSFLTLETDYEVLTYTSPKKALEEVKDRPIDLVIADYLMPEMNGLQFLKAIKETHPHATRILLTGYADKENAIKAINEVGLFQYVEKPWDNEQMNLIIRNGLEKRLLLRELLERVDQLRSTTENLDNVHRKLIKALV